MFASVRLATALGKHLVRVQLRRPCATRRVARRIPGIVVARRWCSSSAPGDASSAMQAACAAGDLPRAHDAWVQLRAEVRDAVDACPGTPAALSASRACDAMVDYAALLLVRQKAWEAVRVLEEAHRGTHWESSR